MSAPGPRRIACRVAASRISANMSSRLLHAAPSAPSDTEMPRRAHLGAPARCPIRASGSSRGSGAPSRRARPAGRVHASSTQTQWARQSRGEASPVRARYSTLATPGAGPHQRDLVLLLGGVGVDEQPGLAGEAGRALEQRRASTTPRSAARSPPTAGRRRAVPAPGQRRRVVEARVRPARGAAPARRSAASIRHLPTTARRPVGASASKTASVSCTVSIVSTVVVPPSSSSAAARRADARQRRWRRARPRAARPASRSQASSGRSSAQPAEQRLAQVHVGLHEAGQDQRAADVDDPVVAPRRIDGADGGDPAVANRQVAVDDRRGRRSSSGSWRS